MVSSEMEETQCSCWGDADAVTLQGLLSQPLRPAFTLEYLCTQVTATHVYFCYLQFQEKQYRLTDYMVFCSFLCFL